jgi:hypothetical protein
MVACGSVCLRRLGATRAGEVRFGRFLGTAKVTLARLLAGWSETTRAAVAGRHVLALQDTSELCFHTRAAQRRGLGPIGRGRGHGLLLHAMLAVDAGAGHACLGLVGGRLWTRAAQRDPRSHAARALAEKESERWLTTAETARVVLAAAAQVTVVDDREGDIYATWAQLPGPSFHLLTRAAQDRRLAGGGKLFTAAAAWPEVGRRTITVPVGGAA